MITLREDQQWPRNRHRVIQRDPHSLADTSNTA
jgi:hypothetical protein